MTLNPSLLLEGSAKFLLYGSLLIAIGASATRWFLLPRAAPHLPQAASRVLEQTIARLALRAAMVAFVASALRVWTHAVSVFGFSDAQSWETIRLIALQSRWGESWRPQIVAALILVLASAAAVFRRAAWLISTLAVTCFSVTMPLLGHAAGSEARLALHSAHILAAGVWLGSLAVVVLAGVFSKETDSSNRILSAAEMRVAVLRHFAPLAMTGASVVVVAGLITAWLYVGSISNLWNTTYGRLLLIKVALVAGISVCGFANWRDLRHSAANRSPRVTIWIETALALAVLIVTAFLTEIAHPE
jgi:copper resistance protein D